VRVERANADELDDVVAVLSEVAAWLSSRGIEQWPDPYPADWVAPSTERGETCLARLRRYYGEHGFVHRGDTTVEDFRTSLYERPCRARAVEES